MSPFAKTGSIFSIALASFWLSVASVSAFAVSPAIVEDTIRPGASIEKTFKIDNDESFEQTFFFTIQKFKPKNGQGQQEFLPRTDLEGLPKWISLETPFIKLAPGEKADVRYKIDVPVDTMAGGNYAVLFVSNLPPISTVPNVAVGARNGILLFTTVDGNVIKKAQLSQGSIKKVDGNWVISLPIRNTGNTHIQPIGDITIKSIFGQQLATVPLNPEGKRLLPGEERVFDITWNPATIAWWKTLIPLTATISMEQPTALTQTLTFGFVRIIGAVAITIIVIIGTLKYRKRRHEI